MTRNYIKGIILCITDGLHKSFTFAFRVKKVFMEDALLNELDNLFDGYLKEKKLRRTTERDAIFKLICSFSEHFDVNMLNERLEGDSFHVSKATLYATLELLTELGLIVRHLFPLPFAQYELRVFAETHLHRICLKCGAVSEDKGSKVLPTVNLAKLKMVRFTPAYSATYVYGICSKCTFCIKQAKAAEKAAETPPEQTLTTRKPRK
ncbi:Oxidative stress genes repressor [Bacteroidales bacterium Barb4]|nr:Oxidative stress genes repressor [Bacteroidales bacterium Barb4]